MRVLVLGGTGMLGHKVAQHLSSDTNVWATAQHSVPALPELLGIPEDHVLRTGDLTNEAIQADLFEKVRPDVVINCVGVVKQSEVMTDAAHVLRVNSVLPHTLAALSLEYGARFLHISTDCVFSGQLGNYSEMSTPDAPDLYGRSKLLGEPTSPGSLTLRTSIIGEELRRGHGLVTWFLGATPPLRGFTNAYFSGVPTIVLAEAIRSVITEMPQVAGLYHVAADRISKYELVELLGQAYGRDIDLLAVDEPKIDRSLDGRAFTSATGIDFPDWKSLVARLVDDPLRQPRPGANA